MELVLACRCRKLAMQTMFPLLIEVPPVVRQLETGVHTVPTCILSPIGSRVIAGTPESQEAASTFARAHADRKEQKARTCMPAVRALRVPEHPMELDQQGSPWRSHRAAFATESAQV
jgi:hypothetical protein